MGPRSLVFSTFFVVGCNYETKDPKSHECTDIPGVEENCQTEVGEESGESGETGETGEEGPAEFPVGDCRHNPNQDNPDDYGWRYQCEGHLYASIDFDAPLGNDCESLLAERCHEHHIFGPSNDTYESPDVMACCGQYDPAVKDEYIGFCDYDLIQQVCISMAKRLEKMVGDGSFGAYAGQGAKLQQWVAVNYVDCFNSLLMNDTAPESGKLISSWAIPNNPDWPDLDNFVISIDDGTRVTGMIQPGDPSEWLACSSALDNNDSIFEDGTTPGGGVVHGVELAGNLDGALGGPSLFGGSVAATVHFSPNCASKGCSTATLWQVADASALLLADLTLFADAFVIANGNGMSMVVDSARISLYEQAKAKPRYASAGTGEIDGFVIPPGDAFFLFSGVAGDVADHYLARNSRAVEIAYTNGAWEIQPFEIAYVDERGETWSVSLGASQWR